MENLQNFGKTCPKFCKEHDGEARRHPVGEERTGERIHLELQSHVGEIGKVDQVVQSDAVAGSDVLRSVPGTAPILEGEVAVVPAAVGSHLRRTVAQLHEVAHQRCLDRKSHV